MGGSGSRTKSVPVAVARCPFRSTMTVAFQCPGAGTSACDAYKSLFVAWALVASRLMMRLSFRITMWITASSRGWWVACDSEEC